MENEIYQILKKHKLPLKKREEVLTDLLLLSDVRVSLPTKDEVCAEGYRIAKAAGYNYRRVLREPDHDIYYSGWMDCFDWISKGKCTITLFRYE